MPSSTFTPLLTLLELLFRFVTSLLEALILFRFFSPLGLRSAGGELPLWKGLSSLKMASSLDCRPIKSGASILTVGVATASLFRERRAEGRGLSASVVSVSEARACLLELRRGVFLIADVFPDGVSSLSSEPILLLRPPLFVRGVLGIGGGGMRVASSSGAIVDSWLDSTSVIPLLVRWIRF